MDWNDIPEDENEIDYWEILDKKDSKFVFESLKNIITKDPSTKKVTEWTRKHQKGLMKSYIEGLKSLREDAFMISMHEFGMFVYVAVNINKDSPEIKKTIEPKPQSTKLQSELEDIYTEDNINKAIKDLGIFTKDEGDT